MMKLIKNVIESQSKRDKPLYELALHHVNVTIFTSWQPAHAAAPPSRTILHVHFTRQHFSTCEIALHSIAENGSCRTALPALSRLRRTGVPTSRL